MSKQIGAMNRVQKKHDNALLMQAIDAVNSKSMSLRAASRAFSIPRGTLFDKISGRTPMTHQTKTVLTAAEEQLLVDWVLQMSRIGYGRTRQEVFDTVKRIIDADGRPNPFKDNRPGKDWWYGFVKRHPELRERMPQQVGKERAIITQARSDKWFKDYEDYVVNEVKDPALLQDPSRLYNADESGFSLCPKSGKIIAKKGTPTVYNFTSSDKTQITVLAYMGATGHCLKPLIVYPGQRFSYNPLEDFPDAVMGRTDNGWMDSELFITWLKDVFVPSINEKGIRKPVMLFVDGHSTHLSLQVSDVCRENGVQLYCLLEHASHLMQPCDLRLFNVLKDAWKQAVRDFQFSNIGEHVTKRTFAGVFRKAWDKSTSVGVAVSGFRDAGLFPLNPAKVLNTSKLDPSTVFNAQLPLRVPATGPDPAEDNTTTITPRIDATGDAATHSCNEPNIDAGSNNEPSFDTLLPICSTNTTDPVNTSILTPSLIPTPVSTSVSEAVTEILKIPGVQNSTKTLVKKEGVPKAITGDKFRQLLEEKRKRKEKESDKQERKRLRVVKKQQKEQDKKTKMAEKEAKRQAKQEQQRTRMQEKRVRALVRLHKQRKGKDHDSSSESSVEMPELSDGSDVDVEVNQRQCYVCEKKYDDSPFWIACQKCPRLFHRRCVRSIDLCIMSEDEIEALQVECDFC